VKNQLLVDGADGGQGPGVLLSVSEQQLHNWVQFVEDESPQVLAINMRQS